MFITVSAIVHQGKIELLEEVELLEGERMLVTIFSDSDAAFWQEASKGAIDRIWDNPEDDVYAQLLQK